ncbi:hypothetical protein T492DRAFT_837072 [Pavlovales sp. CCMP2436]|nr:hypothetical protein T492DRAFT_837072 [Pavlovales sp. CCMP2436]
MCNDIRDGIERNPSLQNEKRDAGTRSRNAGGTLASWARARRFWPSERRFLKLFSMAVDVWAGGVRYRMVCARARGGPLARGNGGALLALVMIALAALAHADPTRMGAATDGSVVADPSSHDSTSAAEAAISTLREVLTRLPEDAEANAALGMLLEGTGRLDEAEVVYITALRSPGLAAFASQRLATQYLRQGGRAADAVNVLAEAARQNPVDASLASALGSALAAAGMPRDAFAAFSRAFSLRPDSADAARLAAVAASEAGEVGDAGRLFEEAPS